MKLEFKHSVFTLKADPAGDGSTFVGNAACFLNCDHGREMLDPLCYAGQLDQFIANGVVRDEHCVTTGTIEDASTTPLSLVVKGNILPTVAGNDQKILVKGGAYKFLSIGQYVLERQWLETPDDLKRVWDRNSYQPTDDEMIGTGAMLPIMLVTKAQPREVSTTFRPMNEKASIISVKSAQRAGLTLDDHFASVLDSVSEFHSRLVSYLETKSSGDKPRPVPLTRKNQVTQVRDSLDKILLAIKSGNVSTHDDMNYLYQQSLALLNEAYT